MPANDVIIKALWKLNDITLSFETGTDLGTLTFVTNVNSDMPKLNELTKEGHTFVKWVPEVPSAVPSSDTTFVALWSPNTHTITFDSNGGSYVISSNIVYGNAIVIPDDPIRTGYSFNGWDPDVPSVVPDNDLVFYAVWHINYHKVAFMDGYGGIITSSVQEYGSDIYEPMEPKREGYTFIGWDTAPPTKVPDKDVTIIAKWRINQYAIDFVTGGGTYVPSIVQDYGTPLTRPNDPTLTGYSFAGWSVPFPETMPAENLTLVADWRINQYTITFDTAGGNDIAEIRGDYGAAVTRPQNPVREGYTFLGWDTQIPANIPAGDMTITARWTVNSHRVIFSTGGGTEVPSYLLEYGRPVIVPDDPERTGYTFTGWYPTLPGTMPDSEVSVRALWTVNSYTVTYDPCNGSQPSAYSCEYSSHVTVPDVPFREGYTFTGWNPSVPDSMPATPLSFTAGWSVNKYTIRFDPSGGSETASLTQDYGTPVTVPNDPVRKGYTFSGWSPEVPSEMPARDMSVTAQWTINRYTMSFSTGDGTRIEPIVQDYGSVIEAPVPPQCTGYTFLGWDAVIPSTMPASDTVFTAQWKVNRYTISFDTSGGSSVEDITQDYGSAITPVRDPTKKGHTFAGWSSPIPERMPAADIRITANWHINIYTITYDSAGGSAVPSQKGDYGSDVTVPDEPVLKGHTFIGWSPSIPDTIPDCDITITATWAVDRHTVRFDSAGGSSVPSLTQDYGTEISKPSDPSREGHTFIGWSPSVPEKVPDSDVTVTAQWRVNRYTITFDSDGGSEVQPVTADFGSLVKAPSPPERIGHRFVRWSSDVPSVMPSHDIEVKAQWELLQYRITVDTDGGPAVDPIVQYYGTPVTAPEDPRKEGHTFAGWSARIPETMPAENVSVTALWSVNKYTIRFDGNGGSDTPSITLDFGSSVPAPPMPRKEGHRFVSWSEPIPSQMPSHDSLLTAQWEIMKYTLSFDTGEGTQVSPLTQDYGSSVAAPSDPSRTGYTFIGWNPAVPGTMPSSDSTVTAVWKVNRYTITFDSAGGAAVESITQNYGTRISPPAAPVREGHSFGGWSSEIPETMPAGDMRISARWNVNSYCISFDTDGGSVIPSVRYDFGEPTVRPSDPVRKGYTFRGWNSDFPSSMVSHDVSLKARWEINVHSVTFCDRGKEYVMSLEYGSGITVPAPENKGHTLTWDPVPVAVMPDNDLTYDAVWIPNKHVISFYDGDSQVSSTVAAYGTPVSYPEVTRIGHTVVWSSDIETVPDEDVTIRASWKVNSHVLRYSLADGVTESQVDYGTRLSAPDPGDRQGYYFTGWDAAIPETMPDSDVTVNALWKPTVKSGTGSDAGKFMAHSGNTVTVSAADMKEYDRATVGIEGYWSVSLDPKDFGQDGNVAVSMAPASKSVMGSVSDRAVAVFSLNVTDGGERMERTESAMTVTMPFEVPEGKEAVVWVMSGGDPVEVESEYSGEEISFSTVSATYWAAGYVETEEDGFPVPYIVGIAAVGVLGGSATVFLVVRRMRA